MNVGSKRTLGVVPSAVVGVAVALIPGGIWAVLLGANLALSPAIPWAVAVMALLIWLLWQYLGGRWGPRATAEARRRALRARRVPRDVFSRALLAGVFSI
ncbi:MAG TPA: hypothetical protein VF510_11735, partial [Ktedonobacterales bacterium]